MQQQMQIGVAQGDQLLMLGWMGGPLGCLAEILSPEMATF